MADQAQGPDPSRDSPLALFQSLGRITTALLVQVILFLFLLHPVYVLALGIRGWENMYPLVLLALETLVISLWLFLRNPRSQVRRHKMEPLAAKYPELATEFAALADSLGRGQTVLLRIPGPRVTAFAFGTWRHHFLALSDGTIEILPADQLRAVALHELGHIMSGDVWKARLATILTVVYFALHTWVQVNDLPRVIGKYGASVAMPLLSVLLGYIAVLAMGLGVLLIIRIRELAADQFFLARGGGPTPLVLALSTLDSAAADIDRTVTGIAGGIRSQKIPPWLRFHPVGGKRLAVLLKPTKIADEIPILVTYGALVLAIWTSLVGDVGVTLQNTLPAALVFGAPLLLLYYQMGPENGPGRDRFGRAAKLVLPFTTTLGLASTLLAFAWAFHDESPSGFIFASREYLQHNIGRLLDQQLIGIVLGTPILAVLVVASDGIAAMVGGARKGTWKQVGIAWAASLPVAAVLCTLWLQVIRGYSFSDVRWAFMLAGSFPLLVIGAALLARMRMRVHERR
jgi:Zn-dependent protease with chaperone function